MNAQKLYMGSLDCGFWNIHGHKSKVVGNKLSDPEFLNLISDRDIVGICEIHSEGEVSIPGFKSKKQKIREKIFKGPKIAGGVGVFVREELDHLVDVVPNDNKDSIWIRLKKELSWENKDIYLGTFYVSPYNTKKKNYDFFNIVNEEISSFRKKGPYFCKVM